MPFDGLAKPPTLEEMPTILRDRSRWPEGFKWNYRHVDSCALGLAEQLGAKHGWVDALSEDQFTHVFFSFRTLSPHVVARRLERALAPPKASWWHRWFRA